MYHRNINQLPQLTQEIKYIDNITYEVKVGIVVGHEHVGPDTVFVYIASPYKEENIHEENGIQYKEIFVFDNQPNMNIDGSYKDPILGEYGRKVGMTDGD